MFPAFALPATAAVWLTPTQDNTWINGRIGGQIMERMSELLLDLTMLFGFSSGFFAVLSGWYPSATATKCAMQTTKISLKYAIFTYSTSHSLTHRDSLWGLTCCCSTYLPYYHHGTALEAALPVTKSLNTLFKSPLVAEYCHLVTHTRFVSGSTPPFWH